MRLIVVLLLVLVRAPLFSQTVIWIEDFQSYTTHPTQTGADINLPVGPDWTTSWVDCDDVATYPTASSYGNSYWGTRATGVPTGNKEFVCNDIEGGPCSCANGGGTTNNKITTELINISSYTNVFVSLKHRKIGTLECTSLAACDNEYDRVEMLYSVNSGAYVSLGIACDVDGTIGGCIPSGNNLRLEIFMGNKANAEYFFLDSIMVTASSLNCFALPIESTKFVGESFYSYNQLSWETGLNSGLFILQKSHDGINFVEINRTNVDNKTASSFIDNTPYQTTYYKLIYISVDGLVNETDLIALNQKTKDGLEILKITNYMGNEVNEDYNGLKIYFFNDGSVVKRGIQ